MARWVRWSVTVAAAAVVFGACLWAGRSVSFGWMPKAEADRWVVATAFATLMGTVAATAAGWWASREQPAPTPPAPPAVSQEAIASGRARLNQAGGHQNTPSSTAGTGQEPGRGPVVQKAQASDDAAVNQAGRDQNTRPGDDDQQQRP